MARTLFDLSDELRALSLELEKQSSESAKQAAILIVTDLAHVTPVDTSQALSNWRVGIMQKPAVAISPHNPGRKGSTQEQSAAATIEDAKRKLSDKKPGETIWISNVLPYIKRLNQGYSQQAPAGFVERALLIGRKIIERIKLKI